MTSTVPSAGERLENGGRIDRSEVVIFRFNGKKYTAYLGDTLASALIANGVHLVGRSWKYHRPRGIVGCGVEEPNAIVQIGEGSRTVPNVRATELSVYQGLIAKSVNCWPTPGFDLMAVTGLLSRLIPAGFYYKTFMWPKTAWMQYEHFIRKASGLGRSPTKEDPDSYEKTYAHCDLIIAGAGPAGLSAALVAARSGARVILVDEQNEMGGSLLRSRELINGSDCQLWIEQSLAELALMDNVRLLTRSTVYAYLDHNYLAVIERCHDHIAEKMRAGPREILWRIRAKKVIFASGAQERAMVFGNNDRPGIMLASAVSDLLVRYAVVPGKRAVVFTNNDSAYQTVLDLLDAEINVEAVVDVRKSSNGSLPKFVKDRGVLIYQNCVVINALGTKRINAASIMRLTDDGTEAKDGPFAVECDLLAVSGGWSPVIHLSAQSGAKAIWDDEKACFCPGKPVQVEQSVGAAAGIFDLHLCLKSGHDTALASMTSIGFDAKATGVSATSKEYQSYQSGSMTAMYIVPTKWISGRGPKHFVDLQNDVTVSDIQLAVREGFKSIEHVKRYTAMGFGTDQGKLGNINGMAIVAQSLGQDIPSTGTTTFRPNYTPVSFGAIAGPDVGGEFLQPCRLTAIHAWHEENGALFENVGQWKRPWYYPNEGEDLDAAVQRECLAVRSGVGIMDASTLGKIDIRGPDAAEFLNRIYTNAWKKLKIDHARYGFMLGEDGMVMDDGVTIRLAEDHFYMHTTTGGAAPVFSWLELWLQTEWPELQVYLTSVTDHWMTAAVVGPESRKVVSKVCSDIDFGAEAFAFMTSRKGTIAGVAGRINRISFSGELAYEVNVPANYGRHVWEALIDAGEKYHITPYGTEAMHVLRAEKGYVIVGQDTDGSVTPIDLGMNWVVSKTKDFIGKRSLFREDTIRADRKQLVGLLTDNPLDVLQEGAQLANEPAGVIPLPMIGHVTSSYYSAALKKSIALALVKNGFARKGEIIYSPQVDGTFIKATIGDTIFYDAKGTKQNA